MDISSFHQKKKSRIYTEEQALADEIYSHFNKELPFPRIMRIIKRKGKQKVYETFNEVRQGTAKSPIALFIHLTK